MPRSIEFHSEETLLVTGISVACDSDAKLASFLPPSCFILRDPRLVSEAYRVKITA